MKEIFKQIKRFSEIDFQEGKPFEFTLDKAIKELNTEINDYTWTKANKMEVGKSYKITVKKYMTEPASTKFCQSFFTRGLESGIHFNHDGLR